MPINTGDSSKKSGSGGKNENKFLELVKCGYYLGSKPTHDGIVERKRSRSTEDRSSQSPAQAREAAGSHNSVLFTRIAKKAPKSIL